MFTGPKFRVVDEIFVLTNQTRMGTIIYHQPNLGIHPIGERLPYFFQPPCSEIRGENSQPFQSKMFRKSH